MIWCCMLRPVKAGTCDCRVCRRTSKWALSVNVSKTKGMAFGDGLSATDITPLQTDSE